MTRSTYPACAATLRRQQFLTVGRSQLKRPSTVQLVHHYWGDDIPEAEAFAAINYGHTVSSAGYEVSTGRTSLTYRENDRTFTVELERLSNGRPEVFWPDQLSWNPPFESEVIDKQLRETLIGRARRILKWMDDQSQS